MVSVVIPIKGRADVFPETLASLKLETDIGEQLLVAQLLREMFRFDDDIAGAARGGELQHRAADLEVAVVVPVLSLAHVGQRMRRKLTDSGGTASWRCRS